MSASPSSSAPAGVTPTELLETARRLARAAAAVLRERPAQLSADAKSTPTDAVTVMDRAAERVILDGLAEARPDDAVVSEESAERAGTSGVTWYVDPLDGTVNYLYGIGQYAVSIAAVAGDVTLAGVVLDVARATEFTATAGGGAYRDGDPISCSTESDPTMALLATGFSYDAVARGAQARTLTSVLPVVRDIRRLGSAALDLCAVAAGTVDGYYEAGMHPWDWMAGALIATESGARVAALDGGPASRRTVLAANPTLFHTVRDLLVAADADAGAPDEDAASDEHAAPDGVASQESDDHPTH